VGAEGAIVRSQVIPDLTPVQFLSFSHSSNLNAYLLAGHPDQRFTLDRSVSLTNWTRGPLFEFLDSSGTLLILEPRTNPPVRQFYRATVWP
jgi:hypothetical protein